ncbi:MAG: hypothetical protein AAF449_15925, partial [Myxococcota bacterium]
RLRPPATAADYGTLRVAFVGPSAVRFVMECPACEALVADDAWICPQCDHILDTSFLDEEADVHEETTGLVDWPVSNADDPPDAMILGDVSVSENEFAVVSGPAGPGRASTFVYYASDASSRIVHPSAIPMVVNLSPGQALAPYEKQLMALIDGHKTVHELRKTSGLQPQEVVVGLLSLIDQGAIRMAESTVTNGQAPSPPGRSDPPDRAPTDSSSSTPDPGPRAAASEEPTADPNGALSALDTPIPHSIDELPTPFANIPSFAEPPPLVPSRPAPEPASRQPEAMTNIVPAEERTQALGLETIDARRQPSDYHELPSVSDVQVLVAPSRGLSDVWADDDEPSGINAASLIEEEAPVSNPGRIAAHEFPADVSAALKVAEGGRTPQAAGRDRPQTSERSAPAPIALPHIDPSNGASVVERLASHAGQEPIASGATSPEPKIVYRSEDQLPAIMPSDDLGAPDDAAQTKEVPVPLGAQFLQEVEGKATPPRRIPEPSPAPRRTPEPSPAPRATNPERDLRKAVRAARPAVETGVKPPASAPSEPARSPKPSLERSPAPRPRPEDASPVDNIRISKAERLFDQALKDRAEGNLVSARMNVKLALTFDPTNELYMTALNELNKDPAAKPRSMSNVRSEGRQLYDQATEAEQRGDIDRAVELLEKALKKSRRAPFLNRLGVLLATKKRHFERAQVLLEEAIELNPSNTTYERNLQKILSMAAAVEVNRGEAGGRKGGGLLGGGDGAPLRRDGPGAQGLERVMRTES